MTAREMRYIRRVRKEIETHHRKEATRNARYKIAYYCELMRNGKAPNEAARIANEKA